MKRLSLEELKAQKAEQVKENLEAISGGNAGDCHSQVGEAIGNFALWYYRVLK